MGCENYHGTIEGQVTQHQVKENDIIVHPFGLRVEAKALKDDERAFDYTDHKGRYRIENAGFGLNQVTVSGKGYFTTSTYIDVRKDTLHIHDFVVRKVPDRKAMGLYVLVEDAYSKEPISGAQVALYQHIGYGYVYQDTRATNEYGYARFWEGLPTWLKNPFDIIGAKLVGLPNTMSIDEYTILLMKVEVAAAGYINTDKIFMITYNTPNPMLVTMQMLTPGNGDEDDGEMGGS